MEEKTPKRVALVTVEVKIIDDQVKILCDPNELPIDKGASNVLISFALTTPGYRFREAKAIKLYEKVEDFPYASWTISDTSAALFDRNNIPDVLKYSVHIVDTKTGMAYSVDPEIQNGGGGGGGDA